MLLKKREDDLIKSMSQISNNLAATKSGMESTFIPMIDQLKQDLLNRDINMDSSIKTLTNVQATQGQLNSAVKNAMAEIVKANEQIGKFFNERFETSFNNSMDQLNATYEQKIENLVVGLQSLSETVDSNNKTSEIQQNEHYIQVKTTLENLLNEVKQKVDSYRFPSEEIKNNLSGLKNDLSTSNELNIMRFKDLETKNDQFLNKINSLHVTIDKIASEISSIKKDNVGKIIKDLSKVASQLKDLEDDLKSIKKSAKNKGKGGLKGLFG